MKILIIALFIIGISPAYAGNNEKKLLSQYKATCDTAIKNDSYDAACDNFIKLARYEPHVYDKEIAQDREKYTEYKWQLDEASRLKEREALFAPDKLKSMTKNELCLHFKYGVDSKILTGSTSLDANIEAALKQRGFTTSQINKARKTIVSIGSPVCMLYAAWGKPEKENKTGIKNSLQIQHIYPGSTRFDKKYFYSKNGIITSWQD